MKIKKNKLWGINFPPLQNQLKTGQQKGWLSINKSK